MNRKSIHIVSFDIPYPDDYGGVQDVFNRIVWLHAHGWTIHLHCFQYHRFPASELEKYAQVTYYKRPRGFSFLFSKWPFIVKTRIHEELINILKDTQEIVLLEGLHCSWYLNLQPNKFWIRTHNVEHDYYRQLASEAKFLKKLYYLWESKKLEKYESILQKAKGVLAITPTDQVHFQSIHQNTLWLPPLFQPNTHFVHTDSYVLYHGNLSVEENALAVRWIIENVVPKLHGCRMIIAGKKPGKNLRELILSSKIELVVNPSKERIQSLIQSAQVHLLWTAQSTGIKLKLLHALSGSGKVICNDKMILGTGLDEFVTIAEGGSDFAQKVKEAMFNPVMESEWKDRIHNIENLYGGGTLAQICDLIQMNH